LPVKARDLPAKVGVGYEKAGTVTAKVETDCGKAGGVTNKALFVTAIFSINRKEVFTNSAVLKLESFASPSRPFAAKMKETIKKILYGFAPA